MQVFDVKRQIKLIKKALKIEELYNGEEIRKMKSDLRNLQKTQELVSQYQKNGFAQYIRQPVVVSSTIVPAEEETVVESGVQTVDVEVMEDTNEG
jgi:hypothetical protein